jgi:hypothetical protein
VYTVQLDPPYRLTTLTRRPPHRSPLHLDRLVSIRTVAVMDCSPSNSCLLDDLVDVQTHSPDWTLSSPDAHAIEDPADAFTPSDFRSMQAQEVTDAQPTATPSLLDALLAIAGAEDGCAAPQNSMSSLTQPLPGSRLGLAQVGSSLQYSPCLELLPNELLLHVLGFLDVSDLLATSRTNRHLRSISLSPILHQTRRRHYRAVLPPLLSSPSRPSLADLIARSIFLTKTSIVSRRLARSLVSIRLARRLAARPSPEALVSRAVLPPECVPGLAGVHVAPGLVATRKAIEKERVKDGLRRWMAGHWRREVTERQEHVRQVDESRGVGRVWRLRRYWERVSKGERLAW